MKSPRRLGCVSALLPWLLACPAFTGPAVEGPAQNPSGSTNNGPTVKFEATVCDFGTIEAGQVVTNEFRFSNPGSEPLVIKDVKASCGCTVPADWSRTVEPGETGRIPFIFRSASFSGPVQKTITVLSNDPEAPKTALQVTGKVWKAIEVIPAFALFNFGPDHQGPETKVLKISSHLEQPVEISEVVLTNDSFAASVETVQAGKEYKLIVTALPLVGKTSSSASIIVKTSYGKVPELKATAYASVRPAVSIQPLRIVLPAGPLKAPERFNLTLSNNSTNALDLSDPHVDVPGVELTLNEVSPGQVFTLTGAFPEGFLGKPGKDCDIRLKSNHPGNPVIRIPVLHPTEPRVKASLPAPSPGRAASEAPSGKGASS